MRICIHVVTRWTNRKAYFFSGAGWIREAPTSIDPGYRADGPGWKGIWPEGFNAVMLYIGGRAYFFRDDEYIRYDWAPVGRGRRPGAERRETGKVGSRAVVNGAFIWTKGRAYFFKDDKYSSFQR